MTLGALHQLALERSETALRSGALVPLSTKEVQHPNWRPFQIRQLLSKTPKHLRSSGPKPNPFLPWDPDLEVQRLGDSHLLLLNKYPVQRGHLLLITQQWRPQSGWLERADWQAMAAVEADTSGLWFFNSCAAAGASQPHRHLQLLPRNGSEPSCPLAASITEQLTVRADRWPWRYAIAKRHCSSGPEAALELEALYRQQACELGLGDPSQHAAPVHPYNLILDQHWLMTVLRTREHWAGFSVNALGFAGYLLVTASSDQTWLEQHGAMALLEAVAQPQA